MLQRIVRVVEQQRHRIGSIHARSAKARSAKEGNDPMKEATVENQEPRKAPDHTKADELLTLVYDQLFALAGSYLKKERSDPFLEPSVLVHEVYMRIAANPPSSWTGQDHFFAIAATVMRRVLIDYARKRRALKRGHGLARVSFEMITAEGAKEIDMHTLEDAIRKLQNVNERAARGVELRFFAGLTHEQVASVLGVSRKTVVADWGEARDFLARQLADDPGDIDD
jgi:RNA polymerase sigma-70 factor, ECF subfamily